MNVPAVCCASIAPAGDFVLSYDVRTAWGYAPHGYLIDLLSFYRFPVAMYNRNRGYSVWDILRFFGEATARHEDAKLLRSGNHAGGQHQQALFQCHVKATTAGMVAVISYLITRLLYRSPKSRRSRRVLSLFDTPPLPTELRVFYPRASSNYSLRKLD